MISCRTHKRYNWGHAFISNVFYEINKEYLFTGLCPVPEMKKFANVYTLKTNDYKSHSPF